MAWEAAAIDDPSRRAAAELVLRHRVLPRDPLAAEPDEDDLGRLLPA
jgi:acyl-CoA dehydrogenase